MTSQREAEAFRLAAAALDPALHGPAIDELMRWADEADSEEAAR